MGIRQCFLIFSDAIEKHRVKIRLLDIDLSPVNKLVGRDVTLAPIKEDFHAFKDEEANFNHNFNPTDWPDTLSSDDEHVTTFPKGPDQRK